MAISRNKIYERFSNNDQSDLRSRQAEADSKSTKESFLGPKSSLADPKSSMASSGGYENAFIAQKLAQWNQVSEQNPNPRKMTINEEDEEISATKETTIVRK